VTNISNLIIPRQTASLVELVDCVCATVDTDTGLPLCWCGLYPGGVPAWEYCGECNSGRCGMGYVTMTGSYLTAGLGIPLLDAQCGSYTSLILKVGVLRCLPTGDEQGAPPPPDDMADVSMILFADMLAMKKAILCCYPGDTLLRTYEALPASGGCVGGEWTLEIELE